MTSESGPIQPKREIFSLALAARGSPVMALLASRLAADRAAFDVLLDRRFGDAPAAREFCVNDLAGIHQAVQGAATDVQALGRFGHREEVGLLFRFR
jgi:hypothetical protein